MKNRHVIKNNYLCYEKIRFVMTTAVISSQIKAVLVKMFGLVSEAQIVEKIETALLSYYNITLEDIRNTEECSYNAYVYVYADPRERGRWHLYGEEYIDFLPLYVGKGSGKRSEAHLSYAKNSDLDSTIQSIKKKGMKPIIRIYNNNCTDAMAHNLENYIIARLREQGVFLCNVTGQHNTSLYNKNIIVTSFNLDKLKTELILDALNLAKNRKEAAELLGVSERTLYRKTKDLGIRREYGVFMINDRLADKPQNVTVCMPVAEFSIDIADTPAETKKEKKK
jgi:hypothetical protein